MLYVGSWYFLVMKEFLKKLIVGVLLIICIGLNFEKSNIIADEWSEPVSFIIVTETVQFLRLQTYMRAIFIFVQQEIHLLQEQNIGQ